MWSSASTLTPSAAQPLSVGQVVELFWVQTETSGGMSETVVNELAAIPTGSPSIIAHTAMAPDGKQPNTRRNSVPSTGCEVTGSMPLATYPLTQTAQEIENQTIGLLGLFLLDPVPHVATMWVPQ